jgi:hypothetical protein
LNSGFTLAKQALYCHCILLVILLFDCSLSGLFHSLDLVSTLIHIISYLNKHNGVCRCQCLCKESKVSKMTAEIQIQWFHSSGLWFPGYGFVLDAVWLLFGSVVLYSEFFLQLKDSPGPGVLLAQPALGPCCCMQL